MKKWTIVGVTTLLFLMVSSAVFFNACTSDPCKNLICKNGGVCRDGRCRCTAGFEGPNCESKMYEKFIGTWDGTYRCNGLVPDAETVIIAPEEAANRISIYNLFAQTTALRATVNVDKVSIESQTIGNVTYSGHGYIEANKYITLYIDEKHNDNGNFFSCVYNATKFINP